MHQELATLRSMVDTRSRVGLVEPKTLMPDRRSELDRRSARSAETDNEERREPEAAELCDPSPT